MDVRDLDAVLSRVEKTGDAILYAKEDHQGRIVDVKEMKKGFRGTRWLVDAITELCMNILGYKRFRGREEELLRKLSDSVQVLSPKDSRLGSLTRKLQSFRSRLAKSHPPLLQTKIVDSDFVEVTKGGGSLNPFYKKQESDLRRLVGPEGWRGFEDELMQKISENSSELEVEAAIDSLTHGYPLFPGDGSRVDSKDRHFLIHQKTTATSQLEKKLQELELYFVLFHSPKLRKRLFSDYQIGEMWRVFSSNLNGDSTRKEIDEWVKNTIAQDFRPNFELTAREDRLDEFALQVPELYQKGVPISIIDAMRERVREHEEIDVAALARHMIKAVSYREELSKHNLSPDAILRFLNGEVVQPTKDLQLFISQLGHLLATYEKYQTELTTLGVPSDVIGRFRNEIAIHKLDLQAIEEFIKNARSVKGEVRGMICKGVPKKEAEHMATAFHQKSGSLSQFKKDAAFAIQKAQSIGLNRLVLIREELLARGVLREDIEALQEELYRKNRVVEDWDPFIRDLISKKDLKERKELLELGIPPSQIESYYRIIDSVAAGKALSGATKRAQMFGLDRFHDLVLSMKENGVSETEINELHERIFKDGLKGKETVESLVKQTIRKAYFKKHVLPMKVAGVPKLEIERILAHLLENEIANHQIDQMVVAATNTANRLQLFDTFARQMSEMRRSSVPDLIIEKMHLEIFNRGLNQAEVRGLIQKAKSQGVQFQSHVKQMQSLGLPKDQIETLRVTIFEKNLLGNEITSFVQMATAPLSAFQEKIPLFRELDIPESSIHAMRKQIVDRQLKESTVKTMLLNVSQVARTLKDHRPSMIAAGVPDSIISLIQTEVFSLDFKGSVQNLCERAKLAALDFAEQIIGSMTSEGLSFERRQAILNETVNKRLDYEVSRRIVEEMMQSPEKSLEQMRQKYWKSHGHYMRDRGVSSEEIKRLGKQVQEKGLGIKAIDELIEEAIQKASETRSQSVSSMGSTLRKGSGLSERSDGSPTGRSTPSSKRLSDAGLSPSITEAAAE